MPSRIALRSYHERAMMFAVKLSLFLVIALACSKPGAAVPTPEPSADPVASSTASTAPVASSVASQVASTPVPTGPVTTSAEAVRRAGIAANAALDRDYQHGTQGTQFPHTGDWVSAADAQVSGDAKAGWQVKWLHLAPAGFEFEARVVVSASGVVTLSKVRASFAPD